MPAMDAMDANTLATLTSILQAQKDAPLRLGSNIVPRNPDVEIAALTLKEIPLTADKFRELSNGQDWYRFSFTVLGVGPPGFSTVPYSSTKKKDEKPAPGLSLYEDAGGNSTRMFTFEKGRTNKDRGNRVQGVSREDGSDDDQGAVDVTAVLAPGMHLAHFLRADEFSAGGKFYVDPAETLVERVSLPAFSVVYFQVSSANVDQAKNGRLLKVKRMKIAPNGADVLRGCFSHLPRSEEDFRAANECTEARNWAVRENMDKGNTRVFALTPARDAFVTDEESSVLVGPNAEIAEALVTEEALESVLPRGTHRDRLKLLNVAIACGAAKMLVRTNVSHGMVLDCGGEAFTHRVVSVCVDVNGLLGLELAEKALELCGSDGPSAEVTSHEHVRMACSYEYGVDGFAFVWSDRRAVVVSEGRSFEVGFRVSQEALCGAEEGGDAGEDDLSARFLDKGYAGRFHAVDVLLMEPGQFGEGKVVVTLEVRPLRRQAGSKRRRMKMV